MSSHGTRVTARRSISNGWNFKARARFIGEVFSRSSRWIYRWVSGPTDPRHKLGLRGERAAAKFLKKHGYKVLYRNFRAPHGGEVDIVCRDRKCDHLVFVEVKTRMSTDFGSPASAVNAEKQRLIARGAMTWLRMLDRDDITFRFDIVEVLLENGRFRCNLIEDAFRLPSPLRW